MDLHLSQVTTMYQVPALGVNNGGTFFRRGRFGAGHNPDGRLSSSAQTSLSNLQPAE